MRKISDTLAVPRELRRVQFRVGPVAEPRLLFRPGIGEVERYQEFAGARKSDDSIRTATASFFGSALVSTRTGCACDFDLRGLCAAPKIERVSPP